MTVAKIFWLVVLIAVLFLSPASAVEGSPQDVRQAAVAGLFYAKDKSALRHSVQSLMNRATGMKIPGKIRALISPHAGYRYSGIVAAAGYRQIDPALNKVVLLGPSHRSPIARPSIPHVQAYETPFGAVTLAGLATQLRDLPDITSVAQAHEKEHSLEVQLPFLQEALEDFEIVPILTNRGNPERLADLLGPFIDERTLVVASSDLSHFHSYDTAVSLDQRCTSAMTSGNFSDMSLCEACGKEAVLTLMHLAKNKGWQGLLVDYKNSGDTSGNKNRVVGYASIAFVDRKEIGTKMSQQLSDEGKKGLLGFARSIIEAKLNPGTSVQRPDVSSSALLEERGCFVTLHKNGQLRGCIGSIEPVSELLVCVEENAKNAAFRDPRFPSLKKEELSEIDIEISVLTVPKKIQFKDGEDLKRQLEPLSHGVILSKGSRRSTFLPQVWKQLPDKDEFLARLCLKGGLPRNAWQDPKTEVRVYRAEVFGEMDFQ